MKSQNFKSMFGIWMMLIMMVMGSVLTTSCEKLEEETDSRIKTTSTTTPSTPTTSIYTQNKQREILSNTTERCYFEKVVKVGTNDPVISKIEIILKRNAEGIGEYQKNVSGFSYTHKQNNPIEVGTASDVRTEGNWKVRGRKDQISALKVNGFSTDDITTSYSFYHEAATYKDNDVEVVFDFVEPTFAEKSTEVKNITSPVTGKEAARLSNTITTTYFQYKQDLSESVVLLMEKGVTITSEDFVTSSCKETVYDGKVTAHVLYRINKSDGSHEDFEADFSDDRTSAVDPAWNSIESSNNQTTSSASRSETGSTDQTASTNGFTAKWKRYGYDIKSVTTLSISTQNNRIKTVEPEGWEISYRGKTFKFNRPNYSVSNDNGTVTGGSEKNGYNEYNYANKFSYTRGSNNKSFTANGVIRVKKEITITSEDFVTSSCKETVYENSVAVHVLYRINKSDGSHEDFEADFSDTRSSAVDPAWSSIESNNNQSTSSASRNETGSTDQSSSKNGFTAKWKRYSYDVKSVVTLSKNTQNNRIKTVEPEGWEISYRGKTFKFNRPSYSVSNDNGTVTGGSEKNGYKEYNYANKFSYTRGSNSKSFTTNGVIKVKVEEENTFFPKEWGTLLYVRQTVANNKTHDGFVYTWSLRFSEGYTLPVVVASGSTVPDWHFEYVEKTDVTEYNGGTYDKASNKWINTTASDKPNQMVWSRYSKEKANKDYQIAMHQNWDEGRLVDGHASTQTSRYQLTVSNGRLTAKDTYTGSTLGSWK